jgi:putative transposase
MRIKEMAAARVRYGCFRIYILLRREGWKVNHKRVYRIYRQEGLSMRIKRPRRHVSAAYREGRAQPGCANDSWSMDFVAGQLADGRRFRSLTVVDILTRECLAIESEQRLKGEDVVRVLNRAKIQRGVPKCYIVTMAANFRVKPWTCGRIRTACELPLRVQASRWTTPLWNRSTAPFEANA